MKSKPKDYPDTVVFHRFRTISKMAEDMVSGTGMTQNDGMQILTGVLGGLVQGQLKDKKGNKDEEA